MCYFEYIENMGFNFLRLELHIVFFLRLDIFKFQPCQYKKNFHNAFTYYGNPKHKINCWKSLILEYICTKIIFVRLYQKAHIFEK